MTFEQIFTQLNTNLVTLIAQVEQLNARLDQFPERKDAQPAVACNTGNSSPAPHHGLPPTPGDAVVPEPTPEPAAATAPVVADVIPDNEISFDDLQKQVLKVAGDKGKAVPLKVMADFGVSKIGFLAKDQYRAFLAALEAA